MLSAFGTNIYYYCTSRRSVPSSNLTSSVLNPHPHLLPHSHTKRSLLILVTILSTVRPGHSLTAPVKKTVVKVCQSKDCCKRFEGSNSLVHTLERLLPPNAPVTVEANGCLSQCGGGPNISINDELHKSVNTVHGAAAILEIALPDLTVPPTLMAAVNCMEKAHQGEILPI